MPPSAGYPQGVVSPSSVISTSTVSISSWKRSYSQPITVGRADGHIHPTWRYSTPHASNGSREREAATRLRHQAQHLPARDPNDPHFRRLWYVRYADDWLLGFSGPRAEAEAIKGQLKAFLRDTLKLTLSEEKTLITHARTASAFLAVEVVTQQADDKHCRAHHRRCINGALGLKVPVESSARNARSTCGTGNSNHLAARLHATDYSIVTQYQAEYRGLVQY